MSQDEVGIRVYDDNGRRIDTPIAVAPPVAQPNSQPNAQPSEEGIRVYDDNGQRIGAGPQDHPSTLNSAVGSFATGMNRGLASPLTAAYDIAALPVNAGIYGINKLAGTQIPYARSGQEHANTALNATVGTTDPQNALERNLAAAGGGVGSVAGFGMAGPALQAGGALPRGVAALGELPKSVGGLIERLLTGAVSGETGKYGGDLGHEFGGEVGQVVGSTVGGLTAGVPGGAVRSGYRMYKAGNAQNPKMPYEDPLPPEEPQMIGNDRFGYIPAGPPKVSEPEYQPLANYSDPQKLAVGSAMNKAVNDYRLKPKGEFGYPEAMSTSSMYGPMNDTYMRIAGLVGPGAGATLGNAVVPGGFGAAVGTNVGSKISERLLPSLSDTSTMRNTNTLLRNAGGDQNLADQLRLRAALQQGGYDTPFISSLMPSQSGIIPMSYSFAEEKKKKK